MSYTYLFFTNVFTSLYTVYINVVRRDTGLNVWGLLYYNTVLTLPVLALLAVVSGDLQAAWAFPHSRDPIFQINFQASIWLAFLLNVSTFYCTTLNSARTQTVVGQLKNFIAFLLGLVLFNDYLYDHINFFGLLVGFAGGIQYSYVQYQETLAKEAAKKAAAAGLPPTGGAAPRLRDGPTDGDAGREPGSDHRDDGGSGSGSGVGGGGGGGGGSGGGRGSGSGGAGELGLDAGHKRHDDASSVVHASGTAHSHAGIRGRAVV